MDGSISTAKGKSHNSPRFSLSRTLPHLASLSLPLLEGTRYPLFAVRVTECTPKKDSPNNLRGGGALLRELGGGLVLAC